MLGYSSMFGMVSTHNHINPPSTSSWTTRNPLHPLHPLHLQLSNLFPQLDYQPRSANHVGWTPWALPTPGCATFGSRPLRTSCCAHDWGAWIPSSAGASRLSRHFIGGFYLSFGVQKVCVEDDKLVSVSSLLFVGQSDVSLIKL